MDEMYEKIEAYWKGELEAPELNHFIEKMKTDPDFKKEVMLFREVQEGIKSNFEYAENEAALKSTLSAIGDFHFKTIKERPIKTRNRNLWLWTIASAAVISLLVFILQPTDLYDAFRSFPPAQFTQKGEDVQNELRQQIETHFNSGDYDKALEGIEALDQDEDLEMEFYEGLIRLETSDFEKAEAILKKISQGNSAYLYDAQWYLALSYLKQEKWSDCKMVLESISLENPHHQKAERLIARIRKKQ